MRFAFLLATLAAAGCSPGNGAGGSGEKPKMTPGDIPREMKQVLQHLETFEGHDIEAMDQAAVDLLAATPELVSPDLRDLLERYQNASSRDKAAEGLRSMSRRCRTLLLLDLRSDDPEVIKDNWRKCRDRMVAGGPADTAFFIGILILKWDQQLGLVKGLLMDFVDNAPQVAVPVIQEALRHRPDEAYASGPFRVSAVHDNLREGLCHILAHVTRPPTAAIREVATDPRYPENTRRFMAKQLGKLGDPATRRSAPAWAVDTLVQQLRDPEWEVRADAAVGLGTANSPEKGIPALTIALKDTDWFVRQRAMNGLSLYGALAMPAVPAIFEMLREMKEEANPRLELHKNAVHVLQQVTGKRFQDLEIWKAWYEDNRHLWDKK